MTPLRKNSVAAGVLTALFLAAPAAADETFNNFQNFCMATGGDTAASLAAADKAGWMALPQTLLDQMTAREKQKDSNSEIGDVQARMHSSTNSMQVLLLADASSMVSSFKGHMCFAGSAPAAAVNFDDQVITLAGVPADPNFGDGFTVYIWRVTDGHHVQVTRNDPDLRSLFTSGTLTIVATKHDANMGGIALIIPTPASSTATRNDEKSPDAK